MSKPVLKLVPRSARFFKESQDLVLATLEDMEEGSAYDIMDVVACGYEGNEAFALRQRVSGACSELHAENRVHKVGSKTNPSSGEVVGVYRVNPYPDQPCECGACPGGGETGYKAKYEAVLAELQALKAEAVPLCRDCVCILCVVCTRNRARAV